ncbi:hypothetical protein FRC12_019275, partial [Ceratobasidium sp. 428]
GEALLADFGNAVLASSPLLFTESTSTRSGMSVRWAAPEILQGDIPYSYRADIYALGMEIISCQPPYSELKNDPAVITAVLNQRYPKRPEDTIPADSDQGDTLWSLLKACWSWYPNDRPEAPYVINAIETIKSEDLLVERELRLTDLPVSEPSAMSSSPRSTSGSNAPETKQSSETPEGGLTLWQNRPGLETDKSVQIPRAHYYLICKAKDVLDEVTSREDRDEDNPPANLVVSKLKYTVHDLTDLLSKIHKLGINTPEMAQLDLLDKRVHDFEQKVHLLLELKSNSGPEDVVSLDRLEIAIGQGLLLQLGKLPGLERTIASLEFSRDIRKVNLDDLTLDQVQELILRGKAHRSSMPNYQWVMAELARKAASGCQWEASAATILAQPKPKLKDVDQLLASAHSTPTSPNVKSELIRVWLRGREHQKKVEACLRPPEGMVVRIDDAIEVAITALDEVYFPAAEELLALSDEARTWEKTCQEILAGRFKARGNATVLDEVRAMRDEGKSKLGAFQTPWFKHMVNQLAVHDDWTSQLPWTRPGLPALDLDSIVRDLTGDTDAENCAPPTNEACTCICVEPVVESGQDTKVAQCDRCSVRFHAECIEGSCPFCDDQTWNGLMGEPPTLKRQHLYSQYASACKLTQHYSSEYRALEVIRLDNGDSALTKPIIRLIKRLARQESPDPADVPQIRHLMCRLYRIHVVISARPEVFAYGLSLAHLHRTQMAIHSRIGRTRSQKPKFVFKAEMNPEASDGSRCLCGVEGWNHLLIQCSKCQLEYHRACVGLSGPDRLPKPFVCPLCSLKEGKSYGPAEVRVMYHDHDPEENAKYVDVKACLDSYSWRVIRRSLPPPFRKTVYVELFLFIPGTLWEVGGF